MNWGNFSGLARRPLQNQSCPFKRGPPERWPSGLRRTLGKRVCGKPYRGFESHSLRHFILKYLHPSHQRDTAHRPIGTGRQGARRRLGYRGEQTGHLRDWSGHHFRARRQNSSLQPRVRAQRYHERDESVGGRCCGPPQPFVRYWQRRPGRVAFRVSDAISPANQTFCSRQVKSQWKSLTERSRHWAGFVSILPPVKLATVPLFVRLKRGLVDFLRCASGNARAKFLCAFAREQAV